MTSTEIIYLDYQATTPVDTRVMEAMLPYFTQSFGNPASIQHRVGEDAFVATEHAREQVAELLGAGRQEIFFCSGATEANNLAIKGLAASARRDHLVVLATEHPAVLDTARSLRASGLNVTELPVDPDGQPSLSDLRDAVNERTLLVSIAAANNEIGTLPPLAEIAEIAHEQGAYFHTDAAQAPGKIVLDVTRDGIDLLSLSAHKMYGPKGAGALYVRRELQSKVVPLLNGGSHERGLRSGTLNVPGIVGLGAAIEVVLAEREKEARRLEALADQLLSSLRQQMDGVELNGPVERLPGNLNLRFSGIDAEALILNCPGLAISAGSACSAATPTPSHVLTAIGLDQEAADQSVRIGIGRPTTSAEIDRAVGLLLGAVHRIRGATSEPQEIRA